MHIVNIEQHRPILKLLAGALSEFVVIVDRLDDTQLRFSMGRSIEMTVSYEDRHPKVIEGTRILINIDSGKVQPVSIVDEYTGSIGPL